MILWGESEPAPCPMLRRPRSELLYSLERNSIISLTLSSRVRVSWWLKIERWTSQGPGIQGTCSLGDMGTYDLAQLTKAVFLDRSSKRKTRGNDTVIPSHGILFLFPWSTCGDPPGVWLMNHVSGFHIKYFPLSRRQMWISCLPLYSSEFIHHQSHFISYSEKLGKIVLPTSVLSIQIFWRQKRVTWMWGFRHRC